MMTFWVQDGGEREERGRKEGGAREERCSTAHIWQMTFVLTLVHATQAHHSPSAPPASL